MSKVILISPPWWDVYGKVDIKKVPWGSPPTGLACIASYLEKHGKSVRLVDSTFCPKGWEEIKDIIKKVGDSGYIAVPKELVGIYAKISLEVLE